LLSVRRKQLLTKRFFRILPNAIILVPLLFLASFLTVGHAMSENLLQNGSFSAGQPGWVGGNGGSFCQSGLPSIGEWSADGLTFSYITNSVYQDVIIENPSTLLLTYNAINRPEAFINSRFNVSIIGPNSSVSSGWTIAPRTQSQFSLEYETTQPSETLRILITGDDNGLFWAGCYGATLSNMSLVVLDETPQWPDHVYGQAFENDFVTLSAPDGYEFTEVLFASYGTPTENGIGSCHAAESESIVASIFIGQQTASAQASNNIFGDPCPGVHKRLHVAVAYQSVVVPTTIPETTTTIPVVETTLPPVETTLPPVETTLPPVPTTPPTLPPQTTVPAPSTTSPVQPPVPSTIQPAPPTTLLPEAPQESPNNSTPEQSVSIDEIAKGGITTEEAVEALSSPEVLQEISKSDAVELFSAIDESAISEEEAAAIVAAVQGAPTEIRETFEDTVDIFAGNFDEYVMVDSKINVGDRKTLVAVSVVSSIATIAAAPAMPTRGGGAPSSPAPTSGSNAASTSTQASKKEDEEETEPAGEIAGDGVDWIKSISIYKEIDGERVMSWKAFIKKFLFGIMNLGFTISGSIVVYFTLSGTIQKIALISTLAAFAAAMFLHMQEPEGE
jgi:hypothetical protein